MHAIASEHEVIIDNLRTAFDNESNAHLRYVEFAAKADGEGWHGVASLFRAAGRAEQIHAENHRRILHQIGIDSNRTPVTIQVESTLENARAAFATELSEVETIYPTWLELARTARDVAVVRTFTWALAAEKTHARLFNEALALLELEDENSWITMTREFYVCPVCGYTSEYDAREEICPTCFCLRSRFETIH